MTTPVGRPAKGRSAAIEARQRLQEQERARFEATTAAIEGVWDAANAQDSAREALAVADRQFREHVDVLRAQGKSMDEIAELTGMPIATLRAARRGGAPSVDGEDGPEGDGPATVPDPAPAKPARAARAPRPAGGGSPELGEALETGRSEAGVDPAAGGVGGVAQLSDAAAAVGGSSGG